MAPSKGKKRQASQDEAPDAPDSHPAPPKRRKKKAKKGAGKARPSKKQGALGSDSDIEEITPFQRQ